MKKDKKNIGGAILEILAEIVVAFIWFGIGAFVISLFGVNLDSPNVDGDSIVLLGIVVTIAILVIICAFVQWFKKIIGGKRK